MNEIAGKVIEFFSTQSEARRRQLQTELENFRQSRNAWSFAVELIENPRPVNVQFYGADIIYFNIAKHFDAIVENAENIDFLKNFLLQKLSSSVHYLPHSVLNKLSSALALFSLKTMPDIWADPIRDLMLLCSGQTELLLRVFAEIPTEFSKLNISLDHRNRVKTELTRATKDIVQLAQMALEDPDSLGSVRNAAVECVEAWLRLPGANLLDFMPTFNAVFNNIGCDFLALSRIIGTLKSNEELRNLPRLVWQLVTVIVHSVCPLIMSELATIVDEPERMEEDLMPLICTIVEFCHDFSKPIVDNVVRNVTDGAVSNVYIQLCNFFLQISNLPGLFPVQECISDLAEPWWYSLREELLQPDEGSTWSAGKRRMKEEAAKWYLDLLAAAVPKMSYGPAVDSLDKDAFERFETYRTARSEISANCIQIAPAETVNLLANNLNSALEQYDPNKSETALFALSEAADFLTISQMNLLIPVLLKCGTVEEWSSRVPAAGLIRFARTFLVLVQNTGHLLLTCSGSGHILPSVVRILLSYLQLPALSGQTLGTLLILMKSRDSHAIRTSVDQITQACYSYFTDVMKPEENRLLSIRCVGMGISFKDPSQIIDSLRQILVPRLVELDAMVDQLSTNLNGKMETVNFELSVLAQLVATLEVAKDQSLENPVKSIFERALPLFDKLFTKVHPSAEMIGKVCDVLKAGLQSLYTGVAPFLGIYLNFLDTIFEISPEHACELAKKLYLTFHKASPTETPILISYLAKWFSARVFAISDHQFLDFPHELDEKLLQFAHHIAKKYWECIVIATTFPGQTANDISLFLQNLCSLIAAIIERSRDISLVQDAFRTLNLLLKNVAISDKTLLSGSIELVVERVSSVLFRCIQSEANSSNVNLIADNLLLFDKLFPSRTRNVIQRLPGGDSQLVGAMFAVHSTRNFRLMVAQMHQAALRRT